MINTTNIKQALRVEPVTSPVMADALDLWSRMYANQAPWLNDEVRSRNLPSVIASEIARAVTIEMGVEVSGSPRADFLHEQMENVIDNIRRNVEYAAAKGGLVFKPYISGDNLVVDFVQADMFYPLAFDSRGMMTACIFADQKTIGGYYYTRLEYHQMLYGGFYWVQNYAYKSSSKDVLGQVIKLTDVPEWEEIQANTGQDGKPIEYIANIEKPLFAYFKMPLANNLDTTSPLGVSIYSRAVDLIKQADIQWSNFLWEFESGKRALYTDVLAFGKDKNGKPLLPDKRLYRLLDLNGKVDNKGLFEDWTPTIREVNILNGLDAIYKAIEFNCGLAQGTISDPSTVALTATEIKMGRQRTYATITDTQKSLEYALEHLLYAMNTWTTLGGLAPEGAYTATYTFDDSIVADHDTQFTQDSQVVSMGFMGGVEFRMRNFGEDEATAQKMIDMAREEKQVNVDAFFPQGQQPDGQAPSDVMNNNMQQMENVPA